MFPIVSKKIEKMDRRVDECGLTNPNFSRIFFFFNLARPLSVIYSGLQYIYIKLLDGHQLVD